MNEKVFIVSKILNLKENSLISVNDQLKEYFPGASTYSNENGRESGLFFIWHIVYFRTNG